MKRRREKKEKVKSKTLINNLRPNGTIKDKRENKKNGSSIAKRAGALHARPDTRHEHRAVGRPREQHGRVGDKRVGRAQHTLRRREVPPPVQVPRALPVRLALSDVRRTVDSGPSAYLLEWPHLSQYSHRRVVARSFRSVRVPIYSLHALELQV